MKKAKEKKLTYL